MLRTSLAVALGVSLGVSAGAQTKAPTQAQKPGDTTRPVWPDEGPRTWAPRPTVPDITANDLRTRLYQFADDSMMGRRIGELGNYKGTAYIASEFKRLGLKPAGDNGTFFQDMPLRPDRVRQRGLALDRGRRATHREDRVDSARSRGDEWAEQQGGSHERADGVRRQMGRYHGARSGRVPWQGRCVLWRASRGWSRRRRRARKRTGAAMRLGARQVRCGRGDRGRSRAARR